MPQACVRAMPPLSLARRGLGPDTPQPTEDFCFEFHGLRGAAGSMAGLTDARPVERHDFLEPGDFVTLYGLDARTA